MPPCTAVTLARVSTALSVRASGVSVISRSASASAIVNIAPEWREAESEHGKPIVARSKRAESKSAGVVSAHATRELRARQLHRRAGEWHAILFAPDDAADARVNQLRLHVHRAGRQRDDTLARPPRA
jgi:hypothetical protein